MFGVAATTEARMVVVANEDGLIGMASDLNKFWKKWVATPSDIIKRTAGYISSEYSCLENGHDAATCRRAGLFCALSDGVLKLHPASGILGPLNPFGAFQRDCGNGQCFQCCYTGPRCHTSFIGFPVINCDSKYGPLTSAAGITLIVDPNTEPGDLCLFTRQTCDHIPLCLGARRRYIPPTTSAADLIAPTGPDAETAELTSIEPLQDLLTSQRAVDNRARSIATHLQNELQNSLRGFHTELPANHTPATLNASFHELAAFIFGRGRPGWLSAMRAAEPWSHPAFVVKDDNQQPVEAASRFNTAQILGLLRLLMGVPNLANRLAVVESRIWSDAEIDASIASVGDVDAALLRHLSPEGFEILRRIGSLQYYGLLAVPLAGEASPGRVFNGLPLGLPLAMSASFSPSGARGVRLQLRISDPESSGVTTWAVSVDWGDGQVTRHALASSQASHALEHTYDAGGTYLVVAMAENGTGLRSVAAVVVATATTTKVTASPRRPAIARVVIADLSTTFLYTEGMLVDALLSDDSGAQTLAGRTRLLTTTRTSRASFAADNPTRAPINKLILVPQFARSFPGTPTLTLKQIAFDVLSNATASYVRHTVTLTPAMLQVFYRTSNGTLALPRVEQSGDGSLVIPLSTLPGSGQPVARIDRIEIAVTPELFAGFRMPATNLGFTPGTAAAWSERTPGSFTAAQERTYLPSVTG